MSWQQRRAVHSRQPQTLLPREAIPEQAGQALGRARAGRREAAQQAGAPGDAERTPQERLVRRLAWQRGRFLSGPAAQPQHLHHSVHIRVVSPHSENVDSLGCGVTEQQAGLHPGGQHLEVELRDVRRRHVLARAPARSRPPAAAAAPLLQHKGAAALDLHRLGHVRPQHPGVVGAQAQRGTRGKLRPRLGRFSWIPPAAMRQAIRARACPCRGCKKASTAKGWGSD
mmetsp:Transcript_39419/g.100732  ORF Transcript_39419/g.100732 Transcript_39419/m.100732 type:complete len:227 (-) Transcript_39419:542-1222(-)